MIYDEDTLRVAAAWSGEEFIDYNAIMLNGKHAVHPRIVGRLHFENKTGPGWASPETGRFEEPRFLGRDDRPYGPLPRDWAHYKGLYHHGNRVILSYTVGETAVLEMPGVDAASSPSVFTRTMNIGPRSNDMILQVAEQRDSRSGLLAFAGSDPASGRIAVFALVPHHGTLLRVSKDGSRTDILAKGFRAANGVCINPDGTFFVTDQEGHWTPKNRINWVPGKGGYYGNFYGYHDVTDTSDDAMLQPLCWITNAFDRSPAELIWVTSDAWGPLKGSLLNTSYGYGMVYVVPHERVGQQMQGGMCRLPIPAFPTGVMRGRFQPGGFYRLRYTGKPVHLPVGLHATEHGMAITFSGTLDRAAAEDTANYAVKVWGLKRTANYGSDHYNERPLRVSGAVLSADGEAVNSMIHNTVHRLGPGEG